MRKLLVAVILGSSAIGLIGCGLAPSLPVVTNGASVYAVPNRASADENDFLAGVRYAIRTELNENDWQSKVIGISVKQTEKPCIVYFDALIVRDTYKSRTNGTYDGCLWEIRIENTDVPVK